MKRLFSLSVVIFWLVMVGLLVRKHLPPESALPLATLPAPAPVQESTEEWKGVYYHNHKVGYIYQHLSPIATGYQWEEDKLLLAHTC